MTDEHGTFEHALFTQPRTEHGYCSDDMARVLVVAAREPDHAPGDAQPRHAQLAVPSGRVGLSGQMPKSDEQNRCVGRLARRRRLLGKDDLGSRYGGLTERRSPDSTFGRSRTRASDDAAFPVAQGHGVRGARSSRGAGSRSRQPARAALSSPTPPTRCSSPADTAPWPWPEERLTYANATLPEAMIAAGSALERPLLTAQRIGALGVAARPGDSRRPPVGHPRRGQWSRRRGSWIRSTAD